MKSTQIAIGVIAALAIAGGGFAAGMTYERSQTPSTPTAGAQTTTGRAAGGRQVIGGAGGSGAFAGQIPIIGRVLAVNDGSITVAAVERGQGQQAAGASPTTTSQIVLVGASTRIVKTTETDVKLADLKVNDQVTVVGTTDSTGIVSANAIVVGGTNLLGQLFGSQTGSPGGFGGRPGASASPSARP
ncbi:MAG: hypothetical protein AUH33_00415 [Chloroflexi bacterium 13_1_40CM_68_21]|nr:MAG: hypothetical protein AUH33_00415 [Chloroflexi bacterium 13_1_40CM_68_21]